MRYAFILNPTANNGRAGKERCNLANALSEHEVDYTLLETESRGHAMELACEVAQDHDVVVAVGGDGTVQEIARALIYSDTVLGVLPLGTGNDFAKALGMPRELEASLSALLKAKTASVDAGRARWGEKAEGGFLERERIFTNCVGAGFDAAVAIASRRYKRLGGKFAYIAGVFETLWKSRSPDAEAEIRVGGMSAIESQLEEDEPKDEPWRPGSSVDYSESTLLHAGPFFLLEIANGFSVGGGFLLTPDAQIDDGLLDVCFVQQMSTLRALQLMPKTFSGAHVGEPEVRLLTATSVHLTATAPLPVQADGEILSTSAISLDIEIIPGALTVRAPKLWR